MKILLIEDDTHLAKNITTYFESNSYTVDSCENAEKALIRLKYNSYALIILDWMLPHMSGLEFLEKIRSEGNQTPVIISTAKGQVESKISAFEKGTDDYIVKPYTLKELLYRVSAIIRRAKLDENQEIHTFGKLEVKFNNHEVAYNNEPIDLTPKEYSLLELLILNKNNYVTRDKIIHHIWDRNADIFTNNVEVHIKNLRKKIDKKYNTEFIKTGKGIGYMFKYEKN